MSNVSSTTHEMHGFIDTAHAFALKSVTSIFDGEHADGTPDRINDVLSTAFSIGLATSPDLNQPGYDYGIWGKALSETGLAPSALMLSAVAEVCGGMALNLHVQGVASQVITFSGRTLKTAPIRVAPAMQEEFGLPGWGTLHVPTLDAPAHVISRARAVKDSYVLDGLKPFMYSMPGAEAAVVFCRVDDNWGCFLIPLNATGTESSDVGTRTGLRASYLNHLTLKDVKVPLEARLDDGDALPLLMRALSLNWLGLAAIGAGIARGAVRAARKYASERYQGGTMLENLPAIRMLIAGAESNMEAASALVSRAADMELGAPELMRACAIARLTGLQLAAEAVTDSLQVFGGYGYMEDYGMEKRLRDVTVLKSMAGTPQYLKQFIFESAEVRS